MKKIIFEFSEEEFQEKIIRAVEMAMEKYSHSKEDIEYLTRKETAKRLHISLPTLNDYTKKGVIKGYRINGRVLYKMNEIDEALKSVETLKYKRG